MPSGPGALWGDKPASILCTPLACTTNGGVSGIFFPGTLGRLEVGSLGSLVKTDLYWVLRASALSIAELTSFFPFHRAAIPLATLHWLFLFIK